MRPTIYQSVGINPKDYVTVQVKRDAGDDPRGHTLGIETIGISFALIGLTEGQLDTLETAIAQYRRDLHTPLEMDVPGGDDTVRLSEIAPEALHKLATDADVADLASENQ